MKKKVLFSLILAIMATMWAGTAQAQTKYDLWLAGTQVTSENCGDLSAIDGVSGSVKYDDATKTLTLDNATIHYTAEEDYETPVGKQSGIATAIKGLTINLIGNNTITSENTLGMYNYNDANLTIIGNGKLTVKGSTTASAYFAKTGIENSGTITVSGCTLEVSGGVCGLVRGHWKFDRCTVRTKGGGRNGYKDLGSIGNLWSMPEFTGCAVTTPEEVYWNKSYGYFSSYSLFGADKKVVTDWVTIEESPVTIYNLKIAGTQVTSANCNDLSVIDGVSGKVNYDHATKTLTLDNATISNTNTADIEKSVGIFNEVKDLTIRLVGNNTITSEKNVGVWNNGCDITFTGDGKLVVNGSTTSDNDSFQAGIVNYGFVVVRGCTLEASGGVYGLTQGNWKFDRCTVRAKGGGSSDDEYAGSIAWFWYKKLELNGCEIIAPTGAKWKEFQNNNNSHYSLFGTDNKVITDWVTITPAPNAIETPTADTTAKQGIYSLSGVRLQGELNNLPKGVYIVNGRKVVKK